MIPFELQVAGHACLRIYDTFGREVTTLIGRPLPPGRHQASWSAGNLPNGTYFYTLEMGETSQTRTLVLLR